MEKPKKPPVLCQRYAGQLCTTCIQSNTSNGDNNSLDAYDLASPCCDPRCVPSASRRRSRSHKEQRRRDSKTEETQTEPQQKQQQHQQQLRSRPHSQSSQTEADPQIFSVPKRYFHIGAGLVSQCSLHSCTSSELSNVAPTTTTLAESSANSYTTSLSTDTLYWDGSCDNSRQLSLKSNKHDHQRYSQQPHQFEAVYIPYNQVKPKSWDNLATKAFGGYGFGYGYSEGSKSGQSGKNGRPPTKSQGTQYVRIDKQQNSCSGGQPQYTPHTHRRYMQPTKSTESLLSVPKYSQEALSDSSLSCECLENPSPGVATSESRFFQSPRQSVISPTDPNFGYYSARTSRGEYTKNVVSTSSEATRL